MRRTKIIATIGPASDTPEVISRLLDAGMDVARLNFSHGTQEYHAKNIAMLREVAHQKHRPLTIIQDLQGPKIRTGTLENGTPVQLVPGKPFVITTRREVGTDSMVSTTYKALARDVQPGDRVLISDGLIELCVTKTTNDEVHTEVVVGGILYEKQGINLPGVNISSPSLTTKDMQDLAFGLEQDIDYIALSFVRHSSDITIIKQHIASACKDIPVIAKIEKPEALEHMADILKQVDGIMVARGDLGVEIPTEHVPPLQKKLINTANDAGIPVITATQMLDSMRHNPRPTRAEASDVANAIFDGTDAVMLSGETAAGDYPVESVRVMAQIIEAAEASGRRCGHDPDIGIAPQPDIPNAISEAARAIVGALPVQAIVAFTLSGRTAHLMARQRPNAPILAMTPSEAIYNRLNLIWGINPVWTLEDDDDIKVVMQQAYRALVQHDLAQPGNMVVVVGGLPRSERGPTNFLQIVKLEGKPPFVPELD
jgi:pyruvate kinase